MTLLPYHRDENGREWGKPGHGKSFPVNTPEIVQDLYNDYNMEAECMVVDAIAKRLRRTPQIKGPYAGTKKTLNREMWERDRKRRKAARKSRKRNR